MTDKDYSRKLKVDLFIDDRNLGGLPDWGIIYQIIKEKRLLPRYTSKSLKRRENGFENKKIPQEKSSHIKISFMRYFC